MGVWCRPVWTIDPNSYVFPNRSYLLFSNKECELDLFINFFPVKYVQDVLIPATNEGNELKLTFNEFIKFMGINLFMQVVQLPSSRMYWSTSSCGPC